MNTTLEDLLHAINVIGEDRDVLVDGADLIAVCPPVKLTAEGRKFFERELGATVISEYNEQDCHIDTYVSDNRQNCRPYIFLLALAGYCDSEDYELWFEGPTAEIL